MALRLRAPCIRRLCDATRRQVALSTIVVAYTRSYRSPVQQQDSRLLMPKRESHSLQNASLRNFSQRRFRRDTPMQEEESWSNLQEELRDWPQPEEPRFGRFSIRRLLQPRIQVWHPRVQVWNPFAHILQPRAHVLRPHVTLLNPTIRIINPKVVAERPRIRIKPSRKTQWKSAL